MRQMTIVNYLESEANTYYEVLRDPQLQLSFDQPMVDFLIELDAIEKCWIEWEHLQMYGYVPEPIH